MNALKDKTNCKKIKKKREESERSLIVDFIRSMELKTKDYDLKYDLKKCVEILKGKENEDFIEMRNALEETIMEKERLFQEKADLLMEIEMLTKKTSHILDSGE